jgi:Flagellar transcriptional activator (FlhC)
MRVSDDRYTRDRQRLDLALRMIQHEARTYTIRHWTGVSDDRIRKLFRSYLSDHGGNQVRRHRGKSPRHAGYFFRTPEMHFQAGQLASVFVMFGLLAEISGRLSGHYRVGSLESCALLCQAYETYIDLHAPAVISFEHAWFLLLALSRHDEIALGFCTDCGGVTIIDKLSRRGAECSACMPQTGSLALAVPA